MFRASVSDKKEPGRKNRQNGEFMFKQFTMELAGRTLRVDIGRVCAQANGAALMH